MRDEDLKTVLAWALESDIAEEPRYPLKVPHDKVIKHVAECPECYRKIEPNQDWTVYDRVAYLPISFCSRCGTPIDWTGALGEDELGEL